MARGLGKKITTWKFDDKKGLELDIPVYLGDRNNDKTGMTAPTFSVKIDDPPIEDSDGNIAVLQERVYAEIRRVGTIAWSPFLHIEMGHLRDYRESLSKETSLTRTFTMNVQLIETATHGGKGMNRKQGSTYVDPHSPEVGLHDFGYREKVANSVAALVPDTDENRVGAQRLLDDVTTLKRALARLVHPDRIDATLITLGRDNGNLFDLLAVEVEIPDLFESVPEEDNDE